MVKRAALFLVLLWLVALAARQSGAKQGPSFQFLPIMSELFPTYGIELALFAEGLANPIDITHAGDGRLFVVEKTGRIRILTAAGSMLPTPFLDLRGHVSIDQHQGLLGLAFDPAYETNGRFYVNYTDLNGDTRIARFTVSADPNIADPASEQILVAIDQLGTDHNGGGLAFSPLDGYLYVPLGDGISDGDPDNRAQDLSRLLGKVLRLDVSGESVVIPPDNPYVDNGAARDEIWASGLRKSLAG